MKISYDVLLYCAFRAVQALEENPSGSASPQEQGAMPPVSNASPVAPGAAGGHPAPPPVIPSTDRAISRQSIRRHCQRLHYIPPAGAGS